MNCPLIVSYKALTLNAFFFILHAHTTMTTSSGLHVHKTVFIHIKLVKSRMTTFLNNWLRSTNLRSTLDWKLNDRDAPTFKNSVEREFRIIFQKMRKPLAPWIKNNPEEKRANGIFNKLSMRLDVDTLRIDPRVKEFDKWLCRHNEIDP